MLDQPLLLRPKPWMAVFLRVIGGLYVPLGLLGLYVIGHILVAFVTTDHLSWFFITWQLVLGLLLTLVGWIGFTGLRRPHSGMLKPLLIIFWWFLFSWGFRPATEYLGTSPHSAWTFAPLLIPVGCVIGYRLSKMLAMRIGFERGIVDSSLE